jgi:hypothetical protein
MCRVMLIFRVCHINAAIPSTCCCSILTCPFLSYNMCMNPSISVAVTIYSAILVMVIQSVQVVSRVTVSTNLQECANMERWTSKSIESVLSQSLFVSWLMWLVLVLSWCWWHCCAWCMTIHTSGGCWIPYVYVLVLAVVDDVVVVWWRRMMISFPYVRNHVYQCHQWTFVSCKLCTYYSRHRTIHVWRCCADLPMLTSQESVPSWLFHSYRIISRWIDRYHPQSPHVQRWWAILVVIKPFYLCLYLHLLWFVCHDWFKPW